MRSATACGQCVPCARALRAASEPQRADGSADRARVLGWRRRRRRRRRAVHALCSGELRRRRRAVPCADLLRAAGRARIRALASASTRTSTHQKIENPICVCYLYASCLVAHKVWRRKSIALSIGRRHLLCVSEERKTKAGLNRPNKALTAINDQCISRCLGRLNQILHLHSLLPLLQPGRPFARIVCHPRPSVRSRSEAFDRLATGRGPRAHNDAYGADQAPAAAHGPAVRYL